MRHTEPIIEVSEEELKAATETSPPGLTDTRQELAQAQRLVTQEKQQRAQACGRAIEQALRNYECTLRAIPHIEPDGRIGARPIIVPLDPGQQQA